MKLRLRVVFIICCCIIPHSILANTAKERVNEVRQLIANKNYLEAEQQAKKLVTELEGQAEPLYADALYELSNVYYQQNKNDESIKYAKQALSAYEDAEKKDLKSIALVSYTLAYSYYRQKKLYKAEYYAAESVKLIEKIYPANDPRVVSKQLILAHIYYKIKSYDDAETYFDKVVNNWPKKFSGQINLLIEACVKSSYASYFLRDYKKSAESMAKALQQVDLSDDPAIKQHLIPILKDYTLALLKDNATENALIQQKRWKKSVVEKHGNIEFPLRGPTNTLAQIHQAMGNLELAEKTLVEFIEFQETFYAQDSSDIADSGINNLAIFYRDTKQYAKALTAFKRMYQIYQQESGDADFKTDKALNNIADLYIALKDYNNAESTYQKIIAVREKHLGKDSPQLIDFYRAVGSVYHQLQRVNDAENYYNKAKAIISATSGDNSLVMADLLNDFAQLYRFTSSATPDQTVSFYEKIYNIKRKHLKKDSKETITALLQLATAQERAGDDVAAERSHRLRLTLAETKYGPESKQAAFAINGLAAFFKNGGEYLRAESLYLKSLDLLENRYGKTHKNVATVINNIASLHMAQGEHHRALPLFERALFILEDVFDKGSSKTINALYQLGVVNLALEKSDVADKYFQEVLKLTDKYLSESNSKRHFYYNNIGQFFEVNGNLQQAENLFSDVFANEQKRLGANHIDLSVPLMRLGYNHMLQGKYTSSEKYIEQARQLREKGLGENHLAHAEAYVMLTQLANKQGNSDEALKWARKASVLYQNWSSRNQDGSQANGAKKTKQSALRKVGALHLTNLKQSINSKPDQSVALTDESFRAGQGARRTNTASAIARMSARFSAKNDELAALVRQRDTIIAQWQGIDDALIAATAMKIADRNLKLEANARDEQSRLNAKVMELDQILADKFPRYTELANPQAMSVTAVQSLLKNNEALVSYFIGIKHSWAWCINDKGAKFYEINSHHAQFSDDVSTLRRALDPSGITSISEIPNYPVAIAHQLYQQLISPTKECLKNKEHVILVPDGPLISLPFAVLLKNKPLSAPKNFKEYRQLDWFSNQYASTVLPSVSSLRSLRQFTKHNQALKPFLGIGNPVLGDSGQSRGIKLASLFTRSGIANTNEVKQLSSLPDTADELHSIAKALNASSNDLMLAEQATESKLKAHDLSQYKNIVFATHGLMAGDFSTLAEPALVLTPPDKGTALDDGLLTSSEISQLDLNADWVILSACNTAASDGTPGAEGLSGLARSFFYAGSQALLVSNWAVSSDATVRLTTEMFQYNREHHNDGRAKALQVAMRHVRETKDNDLYAHPIFWAPFMIVGDGQ